MTVGASVRSDGSCDLCIVVGIGGTFTDIIDFALGRGTHHIQKMLSILSNPAGGVIDGLTGLFKVTDYGPGDGTVLSHGSTVTGNTPIERKEAARGVILTERFDAISVAKWGDLLCEFSIEGPAVVERTDTTTILDPAATVSVDELGNLGIHPQEANR